MLSKNNKNSDRKRFFRGCSRKRQRKFCKYNVE